MLNERATRLNQASRGWWHMVQRLVLRILSVVGLIFGTVTIAVLATSTSASAAVGNPVCPHGGDQTSSACWYGYVQYGDYTE